MIVKYLHKKNVFLIIFGKESQIIITASKKICIYMYIYMIFNGSCLSSTFTLAQFYLNFDILPLSVASLTFSNVL